MSLRSVRAIVCLRQNEGWKGGGGRRDRDGIMQDGATSERVVEAVYMAGQCSLAFPLSSQGQRSSLHT